MRCLRRLFSPPYVFDKWLSSRRMRQRWKIGDYKRIKNSLCGIRSCKLFIGFVFAIQLQRASDQDWRNGYKCQPNRKISSFYFLPYLVYFLPDMVSFLLCSNSQPFLLFELFRRKKPTKQLHTALYWCFS